MIDIVYVVGRGSQWNDAELKYSLRSICKHTTHRNVYVIGHKPSFVTNVIHIPANDVPRKELSILRKILIACEEEDLTQEFLFMNDDHFFVQDVKIEEYPFYHQDTLAQEIKKRPKCPYREEIERTERFLGSGLYFDIHTPIRYDKNLFVEFMEKCPWDRGDMVIKSLYANLLGVKGEYRKDIKLISSEFHRIKDVDCFSVGNRVNFLTLNKYLSALFPDKCRYEK